MSEKRKEANYGFGPNFEFREVRNFDMLIDAINNTKDAGATRELLKALYDYYSAKQTYIKLPDNELFKKIKDFDSDGKDPFELIQDPNIREKAREIIPNEVEIKTSGNIFELMFRISKIGDIKSSQGTFSAEEIKDIILALYEYYKIGFNRNTKPEYYSKIESIISEGKDPLLLLPRTYNLREVVRELIFDRGLKLELSMGL